MDIKQSSNLERNFDCTLHTDIDTTRYGITIKKKDRSQSKINSFNKINHRKPCSSNYRKYKFANNISENVLNKQQYLTRLEIKLSTTRADCIIVLHVIKIVFMVVDVRRFCKKVNIIGGLI